MHDARLVRRRVIAGRISVNVGYSGGVCPSTGGSVKLPRSTALYDRIMPYAARLFEATTLKDVPVRRLSVGFDSLADEIAEGYDLFTNFEEEEKLKNLNAATLNVQDKFGKNALFTAADLQEGATLRERNKLIGGHASGNE